MVVHGHVRVNNQKVNRPSYQVQLKDTVGITTKAAKIPAVAELLEEDGKSIPKWLDRKAIVGQIKSMPDRDDIDADINENLIIEYYSR